MGEVEMPGVFSPVDERDLAARVKAAAGPLRIVGGGTRSIGRPVDGAVLSTAGLSGITLYEPGALTLVAGAGTPLAEVQQALAGQGQRLPFEPMDHAALMGAVAQGGTGAPTLGGMVAANASGPRRFQAGACRDSLIGVRFVDGAGQVVSNGGRVMKNVTGYDLVKLMAGSFGTLGVLTEVALKLLPEPETCAMLVCHGLDDDAAIAALTAAVRTPFEVTGAAHEPAVAGAQAVTRLRIEGFEGSVRYRAAQVQAALADHGAFDIVADADATRAAWAAIRNVHVFAGAPGDVWHLSTVPGDAPGLAARVPGATALYDWAGGRVWLCVPPGRDVRADLAPFRGHATLIRASRETRTVTPSFPPEAAGVAALSQKLRARFDPRGILNSGLMD
jgi:glycolate oxidase FAD binding subunit